MAGNIVHSIVRDSRGLLWFCTNDGLSRFDGHNFVTFGSEHGLGDQEVFDFLETSNGVYWVATARGVSRMNPRTTSGAAVSFKNFLPGEDRPSQWTLRLLVAHDGRIWIATNSGLYRMSVEAGQGPVFQHVPLPSPMEPESSHRVLALVEDGFGQIWAGGDSGLFRVVDGESVERYSIADGLPGNTVLSLALDSSGALWVGVHGGFCRLTPRKLGHAVVDRVHKLSAGKPDDWVAAMHATSEWLWVGTVDGLLRLPVAADRDLQLFGLANGLVHRSIESLAEDQQGSLWIGSMDSGASRLSTEGFTTYGTDDGLASVEIAGIMETRAGELVAISKGLYQFSLNWFDGKRFLAIRPRFPPSVTGFGWGWAQVAVQGPSGEWWIATREGVVGYPYASAGQLAFSEPRAFLRTSRELPPGNVFRVFADSRGDLWISTSDDRSHGLARLERRTGRIQHFRQEDGLPGPAGDDRSLASAFAEDASGTVWIGFHRGGLFRIRDGRLLPVRPHQDAEIEGVRWIHRDAVGRLWVAGRKGLLRVDEPTAERPVFRHYGVAQGLRSSFVLSIAEDHLGRIYLGSGHGVSRLDPATGSVHHYGSADGLVGGEIRVAYRDRRGYLWFASTEGLSRYDPRQEQHPPAPNV
ncbi:MAG TPA: two-component regulator propeller domain-containing protein [Bryobacteraceae bacterium]|nr:two-component regulator propeller domain-containing protein [Bryobacteraceae bacterium]